MASCSTNAQTDFNARNNPNGANGGPRGAGNVGKGAAGFYSWQKAVRGVDRENTAQSKRVQKAASFINPNDVRGPEITGEQRTRINAMSNSFLKRLVESSFASTGTRFDELVNAWNYYSGTTASDRSFFADLANTIKVKMADANATADYWALKHFSAKGQSASDNRLVGSRQRMVYTTQGQLQRYDAILADIKKAHMAEAKRLGIDVEEYLVLAGDYRVAQHMPSRNAEILDRWTIELTEAIQQKTPNQKLITTLESKIEALRNNLDNLDPVDAEGNALTSLESGGMTNAQARQQMQDLLTYLGTTEEALTPAMNALRELDRTILKDRVDKGLVPPEVLLSFPADPAFEETYVPVMRRIDSTTGVVNDSNIFNPGRYHAFDGMAYRPDSAYWTILQHARKAAAEIGMQEYGTELAAAHRVATNQGRNVGLQELDYDQLMQRKFKGSSAEYRAVEKIELEGGVVVDIPEFDVEGNSLGTKRRLIQFNPEWMDPVTKKTGHDLNRSISDANKVLNGWEPLRNLTSMYGQGFTRFNPSFAPKNTVSDVFERSLNMAGKDYYNSTTGNLIRGSSLIPSFLGNLPRAGKTLYAALNGSLDPNSKMGRYWQEYVASGGHQEYTRGMQGIRQTLADAVAARNAEPGKFRQTLAKLPGVTQALDTAGSVAREQGLNRLDKYNDYFNNLAIFSHFITLREAGLNQKHAATGTIEMLNLYTRGEWTGLLSTVFPFVKPTVQTGINLSRTIGLTPNAAGEFQINTRGLIALGAAYAGGLGLYSLTKDAMGEDDGILRIDTIGLNQLQQFLPLPLDEDGGYFKMPFGFGGTQIAMTAVIGGDRVARGIMTPESFASEMLFAVIKNVSPGDWPEFSFRQQPLEYLKHLITPTALKPLVSDVNFMGRPITNARGDDMNPRAEQGAMRTESVYHRWAKMVNDSAGLDLAPEQWKQLAQQYALGPLRILTAVLEEDSVRTGGTKETTKQMLGPWLYGLGLEIFAGHTYDTGRSSYYQAKDYYYNRLKSDGVDIRSREYGSDPERRKVYQSAVLRRAGYDDSFIQDILTIERTESDIASLSSKFSTSIRPLIYSAESVEELRPSYEVLAKATGDVYNNAVRHLSYWVNARQS